MLETARLAAMEGDLEEADRVLRAGLEVHPQEPRLESARLALRLLLEARPGGARLLG